MSTMYSNELTLHEKQAPDAPVRLSLFWGNNGEVGVEYRDGVEWPIWSDWPYRTLLEKIATQSAVYSDEQEYKFPLSRWECDLIRRWVDFCLQNLVEVEMY